MDKHFIEFLGNYLINAAKYQNQTDNIFSWMNQGSSGSKEIDSLFKNFYKVDDSASSDDLSRAFKSFQKNYMELFSIPGMVSEEKYQNLEKKHNSLKKDYETQKEVIKHLTSLSQMKDSFQDNFSQGIDDAMKNQKEFFKNMVNNLTPQKK